MRQHQNDAGAEKELDAELDTEESLEALVVEAALDTEEALEALVVEAALEAGAELAEALVESEAEEAEEASEEDDAAKLIGKCTPFFSVYKPNNVPTAITKKKELMMISCGLRIPGRIQVLSAQNMRLRARRESAMRSGILIMGK